MQDRTGDSIEQRQKDEDSRETEEVEREKTL